MLVAAWVGVIVTVGADWLARWRHDERLETVSKPAATVAIAALALVVGRGAPAAAVAAATVGFACCLVGDVALLPSVDRFIAGLAAFLVGHLAFVAMFVALGLHHARWGLLAAVGVAVVSVTAGRRIVSGARAQGSGLGGPVAVYLAVISVMAVVGWATGRAAAAAGASLFVASDAVLGWGQFVRDRPWMSLTIMVTYHAALVGLALSLA